MTDAHPLRPLVLALSTWLNWPADLLAEVEALPTVARGDADLLAAMSMQAARTLATTAEAFNHAGDVLAYAGTEEFRSGILTAGTALMRVATMPWPDDLARDGPEGRDGERRFRKACLDIGSACFALGSGRVPRPDKANLLTSLVKAVPRDLGHVEWTFFTLPDYGTGEPAPPAPGGP